MTVVIDASVIMKWVVPEVGSEAAMALRTFRLIAPSLWFAEVANGIWRRVLRQEVGIHTAQRLLDELQTSPLVSVEMDKDVREALRLASELNHPIYDCIYLALAIRENTHVVTADARFAALVAKRPDLKERIKTL
jgi:predicted nucleic acid-binding protein